MSAQVVARSTTRSSLLHRALQLDAIVSGVTGTVLVVASGPVADLFALPVDFVLYAGVAMLVWAAVTGWLGTRPAVPRGGAVAAIVVNLIWAIDSFALLVTDWVDPNGLGTAFIVVQAVAVLAVTELQYTGLRRTRT